MKLLQVSFDACMVDQSEKLSTAAICLPAVEKVIEAQGKQYDTLYAAVNLPFDEQLINSCCERARGLSKLDPAMLIIIGIGGSNLGTKAVQEACLGLYKHKTDLCVAYVDTVDSDMVTLILEQARHLLNKKRAVLINIVTKSGSTTETIANAAIFIELLKQFFPQSYGHYIIVTTDTGSKLFDVAHSEGWHVLEIPTYVGGRFSVFSAVGLFPLALMGVNIRALLAGAADMVKRCAERDMKLNLAAQSAAVSYILYQKGYVIHNFFPFAVDLTALGLWYRQLVAESLGKEYSLDNEKINVGITPMVSVGSTDLHSIVELHLGGPKNTFTTFVDVVNSCKQLVVPACKPLEDLVPHIQGKSLGAIMKAILGGTQKAYSDARRPYLSVICENKSEEIIGQFMQWKMLEIIYLGHLFNINPFVQPQVESYKKETRALLARGS